MYRAFRVFRADVVAIAVLVASAGLAPAWAKPTAVGDLTSRDAVLNWMLRYRAKPVSAQVPAVMGAASRFGAFRDIDSAGVFVGFAAGVLASNPAKAEELVVRMTAMPPEDHWMIVRAIAYSGLANWKEILGRVAARMPGRKVMIEKYLAGKLPRLDDFAFPAEPGVLNRMRDAVSGIFDEKRPRRTGFEPSPDVIDTYWGYYYATRDYPPVGSLIAMLPWSKERDKVEKLILGSMAKYTLSLNAARDPALLSLLKEAGPRQPKDTAKILDEIVEAAETADMPRIRQDALAAIDDLRRKGPGSKRDVSWWGQLGQGALSLGCVGAAALGQAEVGVPCVLGGALSSGFLYYWNQQ